MLKPSLVLLDRDGVINEDLPQGVRNLKDFRLLPGSLRAISLLKKKGLTVAIVSNQGLVGRGELSLEELEAIHSHLCEELRIFAGSIDHFFVCTEDGVSPRRKPAPGMLREAMSLFQVAPLETVMIGDDRRDFEAAGKAGCSFILVKTGKGKKLLDEGFLNPPPSDFFFCDRQDFYDKERRGGQNSERFLAIAEDLNEAVLWLISSFF